MIETEPKAEERVIDVSPRALARICPEIVAGPTIRPAGRFRRAWTRLRVRGRLLWVGARFRLNDFQRVRCLMVRSRLRARLAWMRLKHRGRLP